MVKVTELLASLGIQLDPGIQTYLGIQPCLEDINCKDEAVNTPEEDEDSTELEELEADNTARGCTDANLTTVDNFSSAR